MTVAISSAVVVRLPDRGWLSGTASDSGDVGVVALLGHPRHRRPASGLETRTGKIRDLARGWSPVRPRSETGAKIGRTDDPEALAHVVVEGQSDPYIL
jgi:hypothetical protein